MTDISLSQELVAAFEVEHRALEVYLRSLVMAEHQSDPRAHHRKYEALIDAYDRVVEALEDTEAT